MLDIRLKGTKMIILNKNKNKLINNFKKTCSILENMEIYKDIPARILVWVLKRSFNIKKLKINKRMWEIN